VTRALFFERKGFGVCKVQKIYVDAYCIVKNAHIKGRVGYGKSACGVLILDVYGNEYEFTKYLGEKTVPQAELEGLVFALDKACEVLNRKTPIEVWSDSDLVVKWMTKVNRIKKEHIKPIYDDANQKAQRFTSVEYFHHSRSTPEAQRADKLAHMEYEKHNK